ncbi:MAG: SusD/RagB family nutrient-binding outer membrane lipoprotein [Candidatus Marinimicrobia bacterium]|nr:SusD/RagB family nutrient-binding outer membrane lipoprotein [Candidatus Neomarinimicrobiota bacterium]MBL7047881.1 SusD/RagB family nutrient-binding outer membrane lipoprotein [Candidatus Neomarinimicrobiota bacterium]
MNNTNKGLNAMKKALTLSIISIALVMTSCDIPSDLNDNPNEITLSDVDANLFLNGAQLANIIVQNGHLNRIAGMFSGQLVGFTSLYSNIYGYSLSTVESNGVWRRTYTGVVTNARHIRATVPDDKLLVGISKILEAHAVGTLAILMGDVPYSEIGSEVEDPAFDTQKNVLSALSTLLDEAIADLGGASSRAESYDIYYNGDKDKWIAAANTLKARYALINKDYSGALAVAGSGIASATGNMRFSPRGDASVTNGDKNLFNAILAGSRTGDIGNRGSFLMDILDSSGSNYRGNDKTDETARSGYYAIDDGSASGNKGVIAQFEPMPMVTYAENQLILAEAGARSSFTTGLGHLNTYRAWLAGGGRLNSDFDDAANYKYDAYVDADFESGGMENADGVSKDKALLREIIEERYISGFGTYMPFNDHRRLRGAGETDLIPAFGLNTQAASQHVERLLWAQDELTSNANAPEDSGLYGKTEVNK